MATTLGTQRVRLSQNPITKEQGEFITEIKTKIANVIDLISSAAASPSWTDETFFEWQRLQYEAIKAAELAAMWATKAATI